MTDTNDEMPEKYRLDGFYPTKQELYELYWGDEKLSPREIGERGEYSAAMARKKLREYGIPRRPVGYNRDNSVSPFSGFYTGNESAQSNDESNTVYDPDYESKWENRTPQWQREAERRDDITDKAAPNA